MAVQSIDKRTRKMAPMFVNVVEVSSLDLSRWIEALIKYDLSGTGMTPAEARTTAINIYNHPELKTNQPLANAFDTLPIRSIQVVYRPSPK